ncbi:hypothetical protein KVR01_000773 [Diaporthe batatas]|uniref:uncharacterized protein n=1 Tax=Diaporthe batatas TaxID=748121 RepID=UPI001D058690|nr:uncharacterized protein KVR01_000773 [Diaporthe batatas]KAG8170028.1 hypothetical protein KVR01_000773 [Diaporthe batatas]
MKLYMLSSTTALLALLTAASALPADPSTTVPPPIITPTTGHVNQGEQVPPEISKEEQANQYLFNMTLESFISLRDQRYPSYFWWESDGCSQSPNAPFGFPFLPACYRHDFGYDQYKRQNRFTPDAKNKIDRNFRADLYHICSAPDLKNEICEACAEDPNRGDFDCKHRTDMCKFPQEDVCKCLGDIYYTAVKAFGRKQKSRSRGLFHFDVPSIDLTQFGLCLNKNMHSADDKPVD